MLDITQLYTWFRKTFTRVDILIILSLTTGYILTRLIRLDSFPVFTDEGIYIHWAKIAWHDASWRFISLTDGKQPLQTWATIPFLKLFPDNALLAGRLFASFSGLFAMAGIMAASSYLFNKRVAYIAGLLYITAPFYVFYDRMALVDSFVNAANVWILFLSVLLVRTLRVDVALLFGFMSGIFLLAKSNVMLFLASSVFAIIPQYIRGDNKRNIIRILTFLILFSVVCIIGLLIYNIQRLSPFLYFVGEKNKTFVLTPKEFLHAPFAVFFNNVKEIPFVIAHNLGWTTFILGIVGIILFFKKEKLMALYLLIWFMFPYMIMSFGLRFIFSRYTIFLTPVIIILAAYALYRIFSHKKFLALKVTVLLISFIFTLYFSTTIIFFPSSIPFVASDRGQYIEDDPSGWGIKETVDYARAKSLDKPVILIAEGNFGTSADILDVHIRPGDKISIAGYWPLNREDLLAHQADLKSNHVYAVFPHRTEYPADWPLKLIKKFDKPGNKKALYLFELTK